MRKTFTVRRLTLLVRAWGSPRRPETHPRDADQRERGSVRARDRAARLSRPSKLEKVGAGWPEGSRWRPPSVEMDDTWIGGPQPGLRGSRQLKGRKAGLVLVAVEKRGDASGRVRMAALSDLKEATVHHFVKEHIASGSTVYTDAYKSFDRLARPA